MYAEQRLKQLTSCGQTALKRNKLRILQEAMHQIEKVTKNECNVHDAEHRVVDSHLLWTRAMRVTREVHSNAAERVKRLQDAAIVSAHTWKNGECYPTLRDLEFLRGLLSRGEKLAEIIIRNRWVRIKKRTTCHSSRWALVHLYQSNASTKVVEILSFLWQVQAARWESSRPNCPRSSQWKSWETHCGSIATW